MSFILDALRKSDAERQRAVTPGLSDVRYAARQSRRTIWLPILVVVLAANAVFLAVQWFGRDASPAMVAPAAPDPAGASQPAAVLPEAAPPASDIRPLAREAEFGEPAFEQEPGQDVESEFAATPRSVPAPIVVEAAEIPAAVAPSAELPPAPAAAPPATPSRILAGNDLPTAEQLMGSGALNIPILNLDLHVYSEAPAGRFVVINSRKYKEGGQLSEGPTVESITKDGVILSNQGRRFTLSRK
jgi:general secretion pathway protein B